MESFTMQNKAVVIIAKRNSGKSYLLKSMLQYSIKIKEFDKIYCISPTEKINKFYSNIIQEQCIFELYSEEWVLRLIEKMSKLNEGKTEQSQNPINCLLILDDCTSDVNMHQAKGIKMLFTRGRHSFIAICVLSQNLKSVSPSIRNNSDFIFTGQLNASNVEQLCECYRCPIISKKDFITLYKNSTADYNFFVINNNSVSTDIDNINSYYGIIRAEK